MNDENPNDNEVGKGKLLPMKPIEKRRNEEDSSSLRESPKLKPVSPEKSEVRKDDDREEKDCVEYGSEEE